MTNCDNCPTKVENEKLKVSLRTVEAHKLKDIADLEAKIQEVESERDYYKNRNGNSQPP